MRKIDFSIPRVFNSEDMISLQLNSTSKGNQRKWFYQPERLYVKQQFYYAGQYWKDYLVEIIAYKIAQQINLRGVKVVPQYECIIKDGGVSTHGVYSPDFTLNGERFISFNRILVGLNSEFPMRGSIAEKWDFTLGMFADLGLDYTNYLIVMSLLDYLVGNEDRHLNNFGCLQTDEGIVQAPLFDFGLGLFEHDPCYEHESFRDCLQSMQSQPFSKDNQKVIDYLSNRYDLKQFLPAKIDLTGVQVPSLKAGSYLRNRCMRLGIELKGVE